MAWLVLAVPAAGAAQPAPVSAFTKAYAGVSEVRGVRPLLVILVRARDMPESVSRETLRERIFGNGPGGSVATWFNEVSYGQFRISEAFVTPWLVAADDPSTATVDESHSSVVYKGGEPFEVKKAEWLVRNVNQQTDLDFSRFDTHPRDGRITPDELTIFWIYPAKTGDVQSGVDGRSRDAIPSSIPVRGADGTTLMLQVPKLSRAGEQAGWPTLAHELSHQMLHLKDLYVDGQRTYPGVDAYSLMCASASPVHLDPWAKMKLGWLTPRVVSQDGWQVLDDVERSPYALLLHDPARGTRDYFLVENRRPAQSLEAGQLTPGLVVWRIAERHDNQQADWGRKTIDRLWANGEPPRANWAPNACPSHNRSVFSADDANASYALTPWSWPARLAWRGDGSRASFGLWFVSTEGPQMRVYVDVPPLQAGGLPDLAVVDSGSSERLGTKASRQWAALPTGLSHNQLIDVAFAPGRRVVAWYRDGRYSVGADPRNLGNISAPAPFAVAPGRTAGDLVGVAMAPDGHVYAWYRDGHVSAGNSPAHLADYRAPTRFRLPPGKHASQIRGIGIAPDNHVYAWYDDATVSAGSSTDLQDYRPARTFSAVGGWASKTLLALAIDERSNVWAWREPYADSDVDIHGPVILGAYLEPSAVQPGGTAEIVVRAHRQNGRPLAATVVVTAGDGHFPGASTGQVVGHANAAGTRIVRWQAPSATEFSGAQTTILVSAYDEQGRLARVRITVPLLRSSP